MTTLKDFAYQTHTPLDFQVLMDGVDISEQVADIPSIQRAVDSVRFSEYRVGEVVLLVNDPTGQYSPFNASNFFVGRSKAQNGLGVSVEVKAGYESPLTTFFEGVITKTSQVVGYEGGREVLRSEIIAGDAFENLFTQDLQDFGLEKQFALVADADKGVNGRYELPHQVLPVSDGSTAFKKSVTETLTEVETLQRLGGGASPNGERYAVVGDAIETAGGDVTGAATGYPQVKLKAPYRYATPENIIKSILTHTGITNYEIVIPKKTTSAHFSARGRLAYDLIGTAVFGTGNTLDWQGFITDGLYENGKYYFLYSSFRGWGRNLSMLFEVDAVTEVSTLLWKAPAVASPRRTEAWKMAKNGNKMAMLVTDASVRKPYPDELSDITVPASGSYNAAESGNSVYIIERDLTLAATDTTVVTLVPKTAALKAQLAHYYILGSTYPDARGPDILAGVPLRKTVNVLPDSRRKLIYRNNELYYGFVSGTHVGVAKVATGGGTPIVVEQIDRDGQGNEMGLHFDVLGNVLFCAATAKASGSSRALAWTKAL